MAGIDELRAQFSNVEKNIDLDEAPELTVIDPAILCLEDITRPSVETNTDSRNPLDHFMPNTFEFDGPRLRWVNAPMGLSSAANTWEKWAMKNGACTLCPDYRVLRMLDVKPLCSRFSRLETFHESILETRYSWRCLGGHYGTITVTFSLPDSKMLDLDPLVWSHGIHVYKPGHVCIICG